MKEQDYKEIARIISTPIANRSKIINDLADYFEKETEFIVGINKKGKQINTPLFNKKQFLNDCGIK